MLHWQDSPGKPERPLVDELLLVAVTRNQEFGFGLSKDVKGFRL